MNGLLRPEQVASLPAVGAWLRHAEATARIVRDNYTHLDGDRLLTATIEENVLVQLENLRTLPAVASGLVKGNLKLHGWVYKIETGEVFAFEPQSGQFVTLAEHRLPEALATTHRRTSHLI